ncbi:MAG: hypothetical protein IJ809_00375 [Clostridia bacterium]|nr:hypothetical protein [Clostridia bacterium]
MLKTTEKDGELVVKTDKFSYYALAYADSGSIETKVEEKEVEKVAESEKEK